MRSLKQIPIGFIVLLIIITALYLVPDKYIFTEESTCIHYNLFGIECPFCGLTRGLHFLLHGSFIEAIKLNPLILLFVIILLIESYIFIKKPVKLRTKKIRKHTVLVLVSSILILYVYRVYMSLF